MTPEIRLEAVKIASAIHKDVDSIIASAEKLVHYVGGKDAPAKSAPASQISTQSAAKPSASASAPPSDSSAAAPQPAASTPVSDYAPIQALIKKLVTVARKDVLAILQEFGAAKGPELKKDDYPAAHAKLAALDAKVSAQS